MRLTLRTMLAYLDDVLDPVDADTLKHKIGESEFASGLVDRIKGTLRKLRLDAPKLDGKGMGNDANTVAEYLDSSLPQDRVGEFERVCLESDKHLGEVSACHQILTLVLGKAADVPSELRERVYALGDPARAAARLTDERDDEAALRTKHGPPPKVKTNGRPVQPPPPLEVPEYLRAGQQSNFWPFVGAAAAAFAIVLGSLWMFGVFDGKNRFAGLFLSGQQLALNPDETDRSATGEEHVGTELARSSDQTNDAANASENTTVTNEAPAPAAKETTEEPSAAIAAATPAPATATAAGPIERVAADSGDKTAAPPPPAATVAA